MSRKYKVLSTKRGMTKGFGRLPRSCLPRNDDIMKRDLVYILVIVGCCVVMAMIWSSGEVAKTELEYKLRERDAVIEGYRKQQEKIYKGIDSIKIVRNEKDTTVYRLSADSLERIFNQRFGN